MGQGDKYEDYAKDARGVILYGLVEGTTTIKRVVVDVNGKLVGAIPSTAVIDSIVTTDANWTEVATGLTGVLQWKLTELTGNDFYYAYVAAPGDDFQVGFGVVSYKTSISALYVKRPASVDITMKFEKWTR